MLVFHGSDHIIENPNLEVAKSNNDYGKGFYMTEDEELGKEWACKNNVDGILNVYDFDLKDLKILDLNDEKYNILHWIAILIKNRKFDIKYEIEFEGREFLFKNYLLDLSNYDVVIGYRADDSYFDYALSFIGNNLSLRNLEKALKLGNLGQQVVIISNKGFEKLNYLNFKKVDREVYYSKFRTRDDNARREYKESIKTGKILKDDIFILDLLRGKEI